MSGQLVEDLREDEGEKLSVYQDHLGFWTIGVGILVDARKGGSITPEESAYLLENRIRSTQAGLCKRLPWFSRLDQVRQDGLTNMAFQLGLDGLMGFKNSLKFIESGDFVRAGENLKQSLWFKQTPARATRVIKQIVTGKYRNGI